MKRIILVVAILVGCSMFKTADAQLRISLGLNIGSQPDWGPTGYDHADYYYMPDIDSYYDVNAHQYVYLNNNVWIHSAALPARYSNYDVYHGYKVVVNQPSPWVHQDQIRTKYAAYKGRHDQTLIRDSKDVKYRNHYVTHKTVVHRKTVTHRLAAPARRPAGNDHGNDHKDGHDHDHRN